MCLISKLLLDGRLVAHIADSTVSTQHWLQLSRVYLNTFCTGTQAMTAESVVTADDSEGFLEMVHANRWVADLGSANLWVALRHLNADVEWFIDFWQLTATWAPLPCMKVGQGHQAQRLAPRTQLCFYQHQGPRTRLLYWPGPAPVTAPPCQLQPPWSRSRMRKFAVRLQETKRHQRSYQKRTMPLRTRI